MFKQNDKAPKILNGSRDPDHAHLGLFVIWRPIGLWLTCVQNSNQQYNRIHTTKSHTCACINITSDNTTDNVLYLPRLFAGTRCTAETLSTGRVCQ